MVYFRIFLHTNLHTNLETKNGYIVEYTKGVYIMFVVYIKYMQSIQYHVFGIWHTCKMFIRCNKIW